MPSWIDSVASAKGAPYCGLVPYERQTVNRTECCRLRMVVR